eukprot:jgi/Botrbrau1/19003/Bobra.0100s0037.1
MGVGMGEDAAEAARYAGPRKSWLMRKRQEMAAVREGLSEWQANPYYCAGRVTVPAVMDTFACHSFFNKGLMVELLEELAGDDNMPGGALLHQINVPPHLVGRPYRDLVMFLTLTQYLVPLGLYRRKSENRSSRLHYVVTNPPAEELLEPGRPSLCPEGARRRHHARQRALWPNALVIFLDLPAAHVGPRGPHVMYLHSDDVLFFNPVFVLRERGIAAMPVQEPMAPIPGGFEFASRPCTCASHVGPQGLITYTYARAPYAHGHMSPICI